MMYYMMELETDALSPFDFLPPQASSQSTGDEIDDYLTELARERVQADPPDFRL